MAGSQRDVRVDRTGTVNGNFLAVDGVPRLVHVEDEGPRDQSGELESAVGGGDGGEVLAQVKLQFLRRQQRHGGHRPAGRPGRLASCQWSSAVPKVMSGTATSLPLTVTARGAVRPPAAPAIRL